MERGREEEAGGKLKAKRRAKNLRGDELDAILLALKLALNETKDLRIRVGQRTRDTLRGQGQGGAGTGRAGRARTGAVEAEKGRAERPRGRESRGEARRARRIRAEE